MKKLLLLLLCLVWTKSASAFCRTITPRVYVETKTGSVRYITHLSRDEFLRRAPQKMSPNTLGMTVSKLAMNGRAEPDMQRVDARTFCVQIKEINLTLGYDILDVYIDKKYQPDSCEYEVVKEHENFHVRVSQEAMQFFKPDIDRALRSAARKIRPTFVTSQGEAQAAFEKQFKQITNEIQPLIDHINKKIAEKNYIIDTPESYRATTALCSHW